ncbi:MAG TPA: methyltransferase [Gaiellaceae bacterium]|nr:methyltransferase [Gaiellaceae bacterium]
MGDEARSEQRQRAFFDAIAKRYDNRFMRSTWPRNQQLKARVVSGELGAAAATGPVAELGCGTAQVAAELLALHPELRYVGLDLSPAMLEVGRARLVPFADRTDLRSVTGELPLEEESLAGAFGIDVLHHAADPVAVLADLLRALRPGAPVVFLEGNPRFPLTALIALRPEERGLFKIGISSLRAWFEEAGLVDVTVEYGPLYTPPGPARLEPLLDAVDRGAARIPFVRGLAIFFTARGRRRTRD